MPNRPPTHQPRRPPRPDDRPSASQRGYDRTWQRLRLMFLSEHPLCTMCQQEGRIVAATTVDHKTPIEAGGERLDPENLQALCHHHHSVKTAMEDGSFGRPKKAR